MKIKIDEFIFDEIEIRSDVKIVPKRFMKSVTGPHLVECPKCHKRYVYMNSSYNPENLKRCDCGESLEKLQSEVYIICKKEILEEKH